MNKISTQICTIIILFALMANNLLADWAYAFVVHDGGTYVITNETVTESEIVNGLR